MFVFPSLGERGRGEVIRDEKLHLKKIIPQINF